MEANIGTISGGKDSTALWLRAIEMEVELQPVFCDTGHEHPLTYEYLDYLEEKLGPIKRIKANFSEQIARKREYVQTKWRDEGVPEYIIQQALEVLKPTGIPFLDLCIWKGRFPSTKARFCTDFLKRQISFDQVYLPLLEEGHRVISWQGVRAQESLARAKLSEREETPEGFEIYRPILNWTIEEVFEIHRKHGLEPNPLYKMGMGRVGCMPCIHSRKDELFEIARRFPAEIARVSEWEQIVAKACKRSSATFFPPNGDGDYYGIDEHVNWSKTSFGGKQLDLEKLIAFEDVPVCSSIYGLCE